MPPTATPAEGASENTIPEDFNEFERWRENPDAAQPATETKTESAAPAKSEEGKTEATPDKAEEDEQDKPRKNKGGFQRRIDELTREKYQLEGRLQALEGKLAGTPAAQPREAPAADGKPKVDDFTDYDEYVEKLTEWKLEQREAKRAEAAKAEAATAEQQQRANTWNERQETTRQKYDDYDEALESIEIPRTAALPAIQTALMESEIGPEIAYHLAKHPDEAKRIAGLSPAKATLEIGKLEAKLSTPPPAPTPKPKASAAPPPIKPVAGGNPVPSEGDDEQFDVWEKKRNAELRGR